MQTADPREAPSVRVYLLALAAGPSGTATTLRESMIAAHRSARWSPVGAGSVPAASVIGIDPARHWQEALALLDADEAGKASRLRDLPARQAYVYAHAGLRLLLAHELGIPGEALAFATGPFGKPHLAAPHEHLHFSLSRRPGHVALALATAPVGVDVEVVRDGVDITGIGRRFFSEAEQAFVREGAADGQRFFSLWARKEALLKAAGVGLDALPAVDALKSTPTLVDERGVARPYCLHQLASTAHHALAIAVELPGIPP